MTTDDLVAHLVADLGPVRRLGSAAKRACAWAGLAVACVAIGAVVLGPRADLAGKLSDPAFVAENAALAIVAGAAAWGTFRLGVPGAEPGARVWLVPLLALLSWILLIAHRAGGDPVSPWRWHGLTCVARMLALTVAPIAAAFVMLRRGAPAPRTGALALLSAAALAVVGTQVVCADDAAGHVVVWHVVPVIVAALLGTSAGERWLRRGPLTLPGRRAR